MRICSLKSMGEQLEMPQELSGTILQTMYDKAALAAMSPEKRTIYISKTMSRNDELNSRAEMIEDALQEGYAKGRDEGLAEGVIKGREEGREEGRAEGRAEGREEGREEGRADAAKRMVASGMTKEQVAAILQLSANELDTLFGS